LLTKLQVAEANDKDLQDAAALLIFHPVTDQSDPESIDGHRVAELLSKDWGLWRTITGNLERLDNWSSLTSGPAADEATTVHDRIALLRERIDAQPKSMAWKLRARVGERKPWYEQPEEPEMQSERIA
jgi:hypothetical protein